MSNGIKITKTRIENDNQPSHKIESINNDSRVSFLLNTNLPENKENMNMM